MKTLPTDFLTTFKAKVRAGIENEIPIDFDVELYNEMLSNRYLVVIDASNGVQVLGFSDYRKALEFYDQALAGGYTEDEVTTYDLVSYDYSDDRFNTIFGE